jgi:hypothetical protein
MTGLEDVTPEIAASGLEEALKVLRARWKRIIVFCLFRGWNLMESASSAFLSAVRKIDASDPCGDRRNDGCY